MKLILLLSVLGLINACSSSDSSQKSFGTGDVSFKVTINTFWSDVTHPEKFPSNAHFSKFVGVTHNVNSLFWQDGGLASAGIEQMAETGGTVKFREEINDNIILGDSDFQILSSGIGTTPGSLSITLSLNSAYSYLTLVSMLAPSPDWFMGVSKFNFMPNGIWIDKETIILYAYDAGTDSGINYTSSNNNSEPQELIYKILESPFSIGGTLQPVGEMLIERL